MKTAEVANTALEAAKEKQIELAQKRKRLTFAVLSQPERKLHWFVKFLWFITSDNYLCIGGRDAQQNEQLVKRYLRPGDAYLHADIHGAPTCILRAKRRRTANGSTEVLPLSEQALREAGNFAICRSSAWASRIVTSAWWVESHQVSKTAPTGEYLTVGSFMIRGKKNFLPPVQLEMGLGVLFRLGDDDSIARHKNERRDFSIMALEEDLDADGTAAGRLSRKSLDEARGDAPENSSHPSKTDDNAVQCLPMPIVTPNSNEETSQNQSQAINLTNGTDSIKLPCPTTNQEDQPPKYDDGEHKVDDSQKPKKKSGLSAKDRKLIKKYGSLEAATEALAKIRVQEEEIRKQKEALEAEKERSVDEQNNSSHSKNVRGKRSKLKKISKKYADQDEEDRELALLVLQGSTKEKKTKGGRNIEAESAVQIKAAAETAALLVRDASQVIDKVPDNVRQYLAQAVTVNDQVQWSKLEAEVMEQLLSLDNVEAQEAIAKRLLQLTETTRIDNYSASLAGIIRTVQKYGHHGLNDNSKNNQTEDSSANKPRGRKSKAEKEAEKEAWREILSEDGITEADNGDGTQDVIDDTIEISKLTSKPLPEDVILYALPVCAPYSTLSQYKYRVKLVPGNLKKGKASKQCLEIILRSNNDTTNSDKIKDTVGKIASDNLRCINLIKAVNDNEWVQTICGDVKISSAGASKMMKKSKAATKKKSKSS